MGHASYIRAVLAPTLVLDIETVRKQHVHWSVLSCTSPRKSLCAADGCASFSLCHGTALFFQRVHHRGAHSWYPFMLPVLLLAEVHLFHTSCSCLGQAARMPAQSLDRLLQVTTFAISMYNTIKRTQKPFKNLQNSTYELVYPEKGIRCIGEKVRLASFLSSFLSIQTGRDFVSARGRLWVSTL